MSMLCHREPRLQTECQWQPAQQPARPAGTPLTFRRPKSSSRRYAVHSSLDMASSSGGSSSGATGSRSRSLATSAARQVPRKGRSGSTSCPSARPLTPGPTWQGGCQGRGRWRRARAAASSAVGQRSSSALVKAALPALPRHTPTYPGHLRHAVVAHRKGRLHAVGAVHATQARAVGVGRVDRRVLDQQQHLAPAQLGGQRLRGQLHALLGRACSGHVQGHRRR